MRAERQVLFWMTAAALLILVIAVLKDILLPFVAGIAILEVFAWMAQNLLYRMNRVPEAAHRQFLDLRLASGD